MSTTQLDLRNNASLKIFIDEGVMYTISLSNFDQLDEYYSMTINNIEFNTDNNKLILEPNTKSLLIVIGENDFSAGKHISRLKSRSKVSGLYFNLNIEINCYDNSH